MKKVFETEGLISESKVITHRVNGETETTGDWERALIARHWAGIEQAVRNKEYEGSRLGIMVSTRLEAKETRDWMSPNPDYDPEDPDSREVIDDGLYIREDSDWFDVLSLNTHVSPAHALVTSLNRRDRESEQ